MTLAVSPGVDEAQRVLMAMPDLFITLDPDTNRILSYTDAPDGGTVRTVPVPAVSALFNICAGLE